MLKSHYLLPLLISGLLLQGCGADSKVQTDGSEAVSLGVDPTTSADLSALFNAIFGRVPTAAEIASYGAQLTSGTTLAQVRTELAATPEALQDVEAIVTKVLGTSNASATAMLLSQLSTNASLSQLEAML